MRLSAPPARARVPQASGRLHSIKQPNHGPLSRLAGAPSARSSPSDILARRSPRALSRCIAGSSNPARIGPGRCDFVAQDLAVASLITSLPTGSHRLLGAPGSTNRACPTVAGPRYLIQGRPMPRRPEVVAKRGRVKGLGRTKRRIPPAEALPADGQIENREILAHFLEQEGMVDHQPRAGSRATKGRASTATTCAAACKIGRTACGGAGRTFGRARRKEQGVETPAQLGPIRNCNRTVGDGRDLGFQVGPARALCSGVVERPAGRGELPDRIDRAAAPRPGSSAPQPRRRAGSGCRGPRPAAGRPPRPSATGPAAAARARPRATAARRPAPSPSKHSTGGWSRAAASWPAPSTARPAGPRPARCPAAPPRRRSRPPAWRSRPYSPRPRPAARPWRSRCGRAPARRARSPLWNSACSGELTYFGPSPSRMRPPKATIRPRLSATGKITRLRKKP